MSNAAKKLADQLRFLRTLGTTLTDASKNLTPEERDFLGNALLKIGKGLDPKKELGIYVGKGQTEAKKAILKDTNLRLFGGWMNTAMLNFSEGGLKEQVKIAFDFFKANASSISAGVKVADHDFHISAVELQNTGPFTHLHI